MIKQNVSPPHAPDIVIYLDSITLVFEEPSKGGTPTFLPIACVETGNDHGLPNLPLRLILSTFCSVLIIKGYFSHLNSSRSCLTGKMRNTHSFSNQQHRFGSLMLEVQAPMCASSPM